MQSPTYAYVEAEECEVWNVKYGMCCVIRIVQFYFLIILINHQTFLFVTKESLECKDHVHCYYR